jgi:toxin ParE1/3/4
MPQPKVVCILASARQDLIEITSYIANDKPDAARFFSDRLIEGVKSLVDFPAKGPLVCDLTRLVRFDIRKLIIKPYVVLYGVGEKEIIVYRVIHERREKAMNEAILEIMAE